MYPTSVYNFPQQQIDQFIQREYTPALSLDYKYFSYDELKCGCGCGRMETDEAFLQQVILLRRAYNLPMVVTSGYRCPAYNNRVSSTGFDGPHTRDAIDVAVHCQRAYRLLALAPQFLLVGIGVSQRGNHPSRFIHLDGGLSRPLQRPWVWSY